MAKPDFLVIGAQKAGTTWLDKMFKSHPDIWTPVVKELQFFNTFYMADSFKWTKNHRESHALKAIKFALADNNNKSNWSKIRESIHIGEPSTIDYEWYEETFNYAPANTVKGEMTPEYSLLNKAHVEEIVSKYPDIKIILVMRDPVQRALSGIKMRLLQQGFTSESDNDSIDEFVISCASDWDVIERGNYQRIIETWNEFIDERNFLPLLSESLKTNGKEELKKISDFLNISLEGFTANEKERVHVGKQYEISKKAIDEVAKFQLKNTNWFSEYIKNV